MGKADRKRPSVRILKLALAFDEVTGDKRFNEVLVSASVGLYASEPIDDLRIIFFFSCKKIP